MGRVSNPGVPQRVSAHVVPKAAALAAPVPPAPASADDEDEKTTIESGGWEEEASTTVEQGDVAEKVRALGLGIEPQAPPNTGITSTGGHGVSDEPTVDDPRAGAALAQLPSRTARLVITQGNDAGQAIDVRPGKIYTIGRALDNDLVLTDMTVSRKHFDLRGDNGAWVLSDRGSGNGTLVNTRLEDAPFTLATGDVIEIGNTVFRFELPGGVSRVPTGYGQRDDDLDHSTTSNKPLDEPATPGQMITSVSRPRTLPPPAPLPRLHPPTNRPIYAPERPSPQPLGHPPVPASVLAAAAPTTSPPVQGLALHQPPATTLPLPQMANRPPLTPSALGEPPGALVATQIGPPLAALPATLPGQGAPIHPPHPARLPFGYPGSTEMPKLQPRGTSRAMAIASAQPPRDATSTAQVPPMSYANRQSALAQRHYGPPPELSRRTKMVLAGAGLALFAAIATIAIVKGTGNDGASPNPLARHAPAEPVAAPQITPIDPPPEAAPKIAVRTTPAAEPAATVQPPPPPARPQPASPPPPAGPQPASPPGPARPQATAASTSSDASPVVTPIDPPSEPRAERPQTAPARPERRPPRRPERKPEKKIAVQPIARPPARPAAKTEAPSAEIDRNVRDDRSERASERASERTPAERRSGRTPDEVKNGASVLYRARNFSGAAEHVTRALPSFSGADAQELKSLANIYSQLGKSYHLGMAPATKSIEAYEHLRRALDYDRDVGSLYTAEIKKRLVEMSSRAAMQYMASKAFEPAFQAVRMSESLGSSSPSNKLVREKLESVASDLLRAAQGELSTQPEEARRKARQVQGMVDVRHPLHAKATRLLGDL